VKEITYTEEEREKGVRNREPPQLKKEKRHILTTEDKTVNDLTFQIKDDTKYEEEGVNDCKENVMRNKVALNRERR